MHCWEAQGIHRHLGQQNVPAVRIAVMHKIPQALRVLLALLRFNNGLGMIRLGDLSIEDKPKLTKDRYIDGRPAIRPALCRPAREGLLLVPRQRPVPDDNPGIVQLDCTYIDLMRSARVLKRSDSYGTVAAG